MAVRRRIQKEAEDFSKEPLLRITVASDQEEDPGISLKLRLTIEGPEKTPYEGKLLPLEILYPQDYPFRPFTIISRSCEQPMKTRIVHHPSLASHEPFCLSFLRTAGCYPAIEWSPAMSARKILEVLILPQLTCCTSQETFLNFFKENGHVLATHWRHVAPQGMKTNPSTPPPPDALPISVKTLTGDVCMLGPFSENATVLQLQKKIHEQRKIPVTDQRLNFEGKELSSERALADYPGLLMRSSEGGSQSPTVYLTVKSRCDCNYMKSNWLCQLAEKDWNQFWDMASFWNGKSRKAALRLFLLLEQGRAEAACESSETVTLMVGLQRVLQERKSRQAAGGGEEVSLRIEKQDIRRLLLSFL